ncbi:MAG: 30S ribosomal protein S4 [bacterium]|nr:30S ribosomal protein S4 [bacterium]
MRDKICKRCRRVETKLYLKGTRCYTKCPLSDPSKPVIPGQHRYAKQKKISDYGLRLREKQKLKWFLNIRERHMKNIIEYVSKFDNPSEALITHISRRFDYIIWASHLASSIAQARQFITHGFFLLNHRVITFPSKILNVGDVIEIVEKYRSNKVIFDNIINSKKLSTPDWLTVTGVSDEDIANALSQGVRSLNVKVILNRIPKPYESGLPFELKPQLITEFYTR